MIKGRKGQERLSIWYWKALHVHWTAMVLLFIVLITSAVIPASGETSASVLPDQNVESGTPGALNWIVLTTADSGNYYCVVSYENGDVRSDGECRILGMLL